VPVVIQREKLKNVSISQFYIVNVLHVEYLKTFKSLHVYLYENVSHVVV